MIPARRTFEVVLVAGLFSACSGPVAPTPAAPQSAPPPAARRPGPAVDDCAQQPGQPPPEPLRKEFTGVAKAARCQREVYTIMGGVTHFLGVECRHCHVEPDYTIDTHNKQIANWMARELVPRLRQRSVAGREGAVWCKDCHDGKAKILGDPRQRGFAIEWMVTHLSEEFEATDGKSLKCKQCHQGDVGSPEFQPRVILRELGDLPAAATVAEPTDVSAPVAPAAPLPDYGTR